MFFICNMLALGVYILVHKCGLSINVAQTKQIWFGQIGHNLGRLWVDRLLSDSANGRLSSDWPSVGQPATILVWKSYPALMVGNLHLVDSNILIMSSSPSRKVDTGPTFSLSAPTDPSYALPIRRE